MPCKGKHSSSTSSRLLRSIDDVMRERKREAKVHSKEAVVPACRVGLVGLSLDTKKRRWSSVAVCLGLSKREHRRKMINERGK